MMMVLLFLSQSLVVVRSCSLVVITVRLRLTRSDSIQFRTGKTDRGGWMIGCHIEYVASKGQ